MFDFISRHYRLSGCSPFLGDDNQETYSNICSVDYHFDEEYFDTICDDAKNFVQELLIKKPKYVTLCVSQSVQDVKMILFGRCSNVILASYAG